MVARVVAVSCSSAGDFAVAGLLFRIRHPGLDRPNRSVLAGNANMFFLHSTGRKYQLGVRTRKSAAKKNTRRSLLDIAANWRPAVHLSADAPSSARVDAKIMSCRSMLIIRR